MSKNDIQAKQKKEIDALLKVNKQLTDKLSKKPEVDDSVLVELTKDKIDELVNETVEKTDLTIDEVKASIVDKSPMDTLKFLREQLVLIDKVSMPETAMVRVLSDAMGFSDIPIPQMGVLRDDEWHDE